MSSSLKDQLTEHMKSAMRAKDKQRLGTIRLALAAIKQIEVDERKDLTDDDIVAIVTKMVKQRRDSIEQYQAAERQELVDIEQAEIDVLVEYLPEQLDEAEIKQLVDDAVAQTGASSMQDMGKLMGILRPSVQGRADMKVVSALVKSALN